MRYYLKRCGYQELGSVTDGKARRGRYLLMSKKVTDFFPPLSEVQLNDSTVIPILPLYSDKKVYCKLIYHNSKHAAPHMKKQHNEYRLYLTRDLEDEKLLFSLNDIVAMRTVEIAGDNDDTQTAYLLHLIRDNRSALYRELNDIIDAHPIRGGHGVYEGVISEFEELADARLQTNDIVIIDDDAAQQIEKSDISTLFNSVSFRDFVMFGYETLCAITGSVIRYERFFNLEAAHIRPKSHGGLFVPSNGIALCRDMHWAFDKGFVTLTTDYKVAVHPETRSEWLRSFDSKLIHLPKDPFFRPAIENIEYHRKHVYGRFLTSGRL
ncbi:MAG: HNH endonuclease [Defluviitaleaceae bacterium]|nr:HNH endonuclease [Defluviitaleaceae bacterium]